jgi:drug/metabolite transporter (DMT)-like permease
MLAFLRYVLPALLVFAGVVLLSFGGESVRYDGFGLCAGAGIALAVFAQLIRLNTSGASDRDDEEAARRYFTEHGHWPDEAPPDRG